MPERIHQGLMGGMRGAVFFEGGWRGGARAGGAEKEKFWGRHGTRGGGALCYGAPWP